MMKNMRVGKSEFLLLKGNVDKKIFIVDNFQDIKNAMIFFEVTNGSCMKKKIIKIFILVFESALGVYKVISLMAATVGW